MYFLWKKIFQMGVHGLRRNDGGTFETKLSKMSQFTLFVSFYSSISIYPNCLKFPTYLKNHQRIILPLYRQVILIQFLVTRRVFKFKNAFLLCAQTFSLVEPFYLGIWYNVTRNNLLIFYNWKWKIKPNLISRRLRNRIVRVRNPK